MSYNLDTFSPPDSIYLADFPLELSLTPYNGFISYIRSYHIWFTRDEVDTLLSLPHDKISELEDPIIERHLEKIHEVHIQQEIDLCRDIILDEIFDQPKKHLYQILLSFWCNEALLKSVFQNNNVYWFNLAVIMENGKNSNIDISLEHLSDGDVQIIYNGLVFLSDKCWPVRNTHIFPFSRLIK